MMPDDLIPSMRLIVQQAPNASAYAKEEYIASPQNNSQ